jgi:hypothetical protein
MLPDLRAKLKASEQCKIEAEKALEDYGSRFHDWETIALETESKNKKEVKELAARLWETIVLQQEFTAEAKTGVQSENTGPPRNLLRFFAQVKEAREARRKRVSREKGLAEMLSAVNMELMIRHKRTADLEQTRKGWVHGRSGLELKINPPAHQPSALSRCAYELCDENISDRFSISSDYDDSYVLTFNRSVASWCKPEIKNILDQYDPPSLINSKSTYANPSVNGSVSAYRNTSTYGNASVYGWSSVNGSSGGSSSTYYSTSYTPYTPSSPSYTRTKAARKRSPPRRYDGRGCGSRCASSEPSYMTCETTFSCGGG